MHGEQVALLQGHAQVARGHLFAHRARPAGGAQDGTARLQDGAPAAQRTPLPSPAPFDVQRPVVGFRAVFAFMADPTPTSDELAELSNKIGAWAAQPGVAGRLASVTIGRNRASLRQEPNDPLALWCARTHTHSQPGPYATMFSCCRAELEWRLLASLSASLQRAGMGASVRYIPMDTTPAALRPFQSTAGQPAPRPASIKCERGARFCFTARLPPAPPALPRPAPKKPSFVSKRKYGRDAQRATR